MSQTGICRFSASLELDMLQKLETYRRRRGLSSRSDAIRSLVRGEVLDDGWKGSGEAYGVVTLLYDHHGRETLRQLTKIQHDAKVKIVVSQHIHLSHATCLEVITVSGRPSELEALAVKLGGVHGVKRASLARAAVQEDLSGAHH